MSNKGKNDSENIRDKVKRFFRSGSKPTVGSIQQKHPQREKVITPQILKDIGPESPANNRIRIIKELSEKVLQKKLEENAVEALWVSIKDLIQPHNHADSRRVALCFLKDVIEGQFHHLGILRGHFFNVIKSLDLPRDQIDRLELLAKLTDNGKDLQYIEDEMGPFLCEWMPAVLLSGHIREFLQLLVNIIKYNAAYLDEEVIGNLVQQTCLSIHQDEEDIKCCLNVLNAVVCYSYLPSDCLHHFVSTLCRMVNMPKLCGDSWELMRKLLGTHLGHSAVYTMCHMLQDRSPNRDFQLLRGAVFYIGMGLWGSKRVQSLKHTASSVLPSLKQALSCGSDVVVYEVILSVQRLVKKYGKDMNHVTWSITLDIVELLTKHTQDHPPSDPRLLTDVHDILTTIEELHQRGQFCGAVVPHLFQIIEMCASQRPELSISLLIAHHAQVIKPEKENWMQSLSQLMDMYFKRETRTAIRVKTLQVLSSVLDIYKHVYEQELLDKIVLFFLCHIDSDPDADIRREAAEILLGLATSCSSDSYFELLNIIKKLMQRPLAAQSRQSPSSPMAFSDRLPIPDESHLYDVLVATMGITNLFQHKLYHLPSTHCVQVYELMIHHVNAHYKERFWNKTGGQIRKTILLYLMDLRADNRDRVGLATKFRDIGLKFSPYVVCKNSFGSKSLSSSNTSSSQSPWSQSVTVLDYNDTFALLINCLQEELDWCVLNCVLDKFPELLQNKTLVLSAGNVSHVDVLCMCLCAMVTNRQLDLPDKLYNLPPEKFTRSDFHTYVFPVLAAMVNYHSYLDRTRQVELIKCLEFGLVSKCAKVCVNALRLCTLEMQDVMMRLLPAVLLQLSKISATTAMAIPVLAFLSSIVTLPRMYINFVEEEYMSVFAIALPYTNPFRFSHYTVSLAHHVIAVWFIRCRLPFRKGFVKFIHKGLRANVLQQFEENAALSLLNEDSSDRGRAGSYNETALRRRRMASGSAIHKKRAPLNEKLAQFHRELTETCMDVMARYTFANFSTLPHRSEVTEFLLAGGQSQTWLLGNKLITVTTSGGGSRTGTSGLCDKCLSLCEATLEPESNRPKKERRRHKSAATFSRSTSQIEPCSPSDDNVLLQARRSLDDMSLPSDTSTSDPIVMTDSVGVQTGSSLKNTSSPGSGTESLDSLLLSMKGPRPSGGLFNSPMCNCWCIGWAEIQIRSASGNLSWMMRIENDPSSLPSSSEVPLSDITMLFAPWNRKLPDVERAGRIDSESLGEDEYDSLHAQHFPDSADAVDTAPTITPVFEVAENVRVNYDQQESVEEKPSSVSPTLRRSNSSPSLLTYYESNSGQSDGDSDSSSKSPTSPRSNRLQSSQSDIVQPVADVWKLGSDSILKGGIVKQKDASLNVAHTIVKPGVFATKVAFVDKESAIRSNAELSSDDSSSKKTEDENPSAVIGIEHEKLPGEGRDDVSTSDLRVAGINVCDVPQSSTDSSDQSSSITDSVSELPNVRKMRGHTISVMSSAADESKGSRGRDLSGSPGGINPSFVFLQLYHGLLAQSSTEAPIQLPSNDTTKRALKMLDHIHPYETHKLGVIYVGHGQAENESAILSNVYGSERYVKFVQGLGQLLRLKNCDPEKVYVGGLSQSGSDGDFAYSWQDETIHVIFHVATMMPLREKDPQCNAKKLHIGNDFVTIVYNDSGRNYSIGTLKGQFNYVNIVIRPLDYDSNAVTLEAKEDIADILGHTDTKVISDTNLPQLVRQIAIHCNLASMVLQRQQLSQSQDPFASNWLERLRKIKRIREKAVSAESDPASVSADTKPANRAGLVDFTDYV